VVAIVLGLLTMTPFIGFITKHKSQLFLLMRYLLGGGTAATTNLLLLFVFTDYFHWWYLAASTIAFIISGFVSFTVQKFITFRDRTTDKIHHQAVMYLSFALFNIMANGGLMFSFVELAHVHYLLAQVFSGVIIAAWSLVVYRYVIFNTK
jgi:putative flippase GtrA